MTRLVPRPVLLWILALLAGLAIAWHSRFNADMSFVLPLHPTPSQEVMIRQIKEGVVSRLLMVGIGGGDADQRAQASRDLRARLVASGAFTSVQNGEAGSQDADREYLFRNRYLLSPAVTPARFTVEGLRESIGASIDLLASPAGMMLKRSLPQDPTGELWAQISALDPTSEPPSRAGVWASRDGGRALLVLQTKALGSDTDGQEQALATLDAQFEQVRQTPGLTALTLEVAGPGRFAVKARDTIREEVSRLSILSTVAIVVVLAFVYRSPRLVFLGLLPVASGALAGVVAVSLIFGTVFGITIGFGAALIGEAVDYSIYYFLQSGRVGAEAWRTRFWPTVRLGVLTSLAGFGALLFSGFPGLAQLGLYAMSGVLTAALVTRFVLPVLAGPVPAVRDLTGPGIRLAAMGQALRRGRWAALVLAVLALTHLAIHRGDLWQANISALSSVDPADLAVDQALRADIGAPDARYMVVVQGINQEAALQAAEAAGARLDRLVESGRLGGYDSPARFLPSQALQRQRQAALPEPADLARRLAVAQADSPLPANRLAPFLADIAAARAQPLIGRDQLDGTQLALATDALMERHPAGWGVLLPLRPAGGDGEIDTDAVRAALVGTGALFIDLKGELNHLYASYLGEALVLALAGVAAIVALLAATLRSLPRLVAVIGPLGLAVVLVMAGLHALGQPLHLLHLVGFLLIVAVGSNYALFFERSADSAGIDPTTLTSMVVANITTVIGFGVLGLSSVPVLHAVGVTVGPGAALVLVLSAAFLTRRAAPA
ncbi:MAG: MMPL family transporter [Zoogloeaceae bacterium]|nr:MMPL family transporter [Zoogloeaceae bacterium]